MTRTRISRPDRDMPAWPARQAAAGLKTFTDWLHAAAPRGRPGVSIVSEVSYYRTGSVAVIEAPEYFDACNAPRVRETAIVLQSCGVPGIVFDLTAVTFIDNAAPGVIAGTCNRLGPPGGQVAVAGAAKQVARPLQATGLSRIVPLFATCQEAVSFLQARDGGK